jgi:hypothetical protein
MTPTNKEADWAKEFDAMFTVYFDNVGRPTPTSYSGWCNDDIKAFISSLIAQKQREARKEVIDHVIKYSRKDEEDGSALHLTITKQLIESLEKNLSVLEGIKENEP